MTAKRGDKPKRVLKDLEGWMTLPAAAKFLGCTRARAYQMVEEFVFSDAEVRKVDGTSEDRPAAILVRTRKVEQLKAKQDAEAARLLDEVESEMAGEEPVLVG